MKLLLDTHLLLWAAGAPPKLSRAAVALLDNPENELMFSAVNLWEIAIKRSLGRAGFEVEPQVFLRRLLANGYSELPVSSAHAVAVGELPNHHRDPFDRLLVAQAIVEGVVLVTADAALARYPGPIRKV